MRASERALRHPFRLLEPFHALAEITESGVGVIRSGPLSTASARWVGVCGATVEVRKATGGAAHYSEKFVLYVGTKGLGHIVLAAVIR